MKNDVFNYLRQSSTYKEVKEYTVDDKIQLLGLSEERVEKLKRLHTNDINFDYDKHLRSPELIEINCDDIVGTTRFDRMSWLDILGIKLHKRGNFEKYVKEEFKSFIISGKEPNDGFPEVVKKGNNYYIAGNGLHRLTIAKCIGDMRATVVVRYW